MDELDGNLRRATPQTASIGESRKSLAAECRTARAALASYLKENNLTVEAFANRLDSAEKNAPGTSVRALIRLMAGHLSDDPGLIMHISYIIDDNERPDGVADEVYSGPYFDLDERGAIMRRLLKYNLDNGIGIPQLAKRVFPRQSMAPWKTMQRFLKSARARHAFVAACATFVANLPEPPDPVRELGEGLVAVYGRNTAEEIIGTFDIAINCSTVFSTQEWRRTLQITEDDGFYRIKEQTNGTLSYDGALAIIRSGSALAVLRDISEREYAVTYAISFSGTHFNGVGCDSSWDQLKFVTADV